MIAERPALVRVRYQVCMEAARTVVTALIRIHHDPANPDPSSTDQEAK